jgi:hypothetical protein
MVIDRIHVVQRRHRFVVAGERTVVVALRRAWLRQVSAVNLAMRLVRRLSRDHSSRLNVGLTVSIDLLPEIGLEVLGEVRGVGGIQEQAVERVILGLLLLVIDRCNQGIGPELVVLARLGKFVVALGVLVHRGLEVEHGLVRVDQVHRPVGGLRERFLGVGTRHRWVHMLRKLRLAFVIEHVDVRHNALLGR